MSRLFALALIGIGVAACAPRVVRAPHSLPPSVQLKTASLGRVWVAGFATTRSAGLDVSAETVRLLRARSCVACRPHTSSRERRSRSTPSNACQMCRTGERLVKNMERPLIVTGTVKLRLAPPAIVERGPRTIYMPTAGRDLEATVVLIDGRTGMAISVRKLPTRRRYGIGRFSSSLSLFLQLMDRAMPDWLGAIASAPPATPNRESTEIRE